MQSSGFEYKCTKSVFENANTHIRNMIGTIRDFLQIRSYIKNRNTENKFIGEEHEKLYDLTHSFLNADIVIIGTQQRMIPKLFSFYCNKNNGPLVLVLYKLSASKYKQLGIPQIDSNFIFVNINNYDIPEIISRIKEFTFARHKRKT
ncbi:MAG: hypothetical protein U9R19_17645 [Bacteroidota bacterium]|nr:hypothetical protein [Bacteroidota bacterium]